MQSGWRPTAPVGRRRSLYMRLPVWASPWARPAACSRRRCRAQAGRSAATSRQLSSVSASGTDRCTISTPMPIHDPPPAGKSRRKWNSSRGNSCRAAGDAETASRLSSSTAEEPRAPAGWPCTGSALRSLTQKGAPPSSRAAATTTGCGRPSETSLKRSSRSRTIIVPEPKAALR